MSRKAITMKRSCFGFLLLTCAFSTCSLSGWSQTGATGALSVSVTDSSGALVNKANLTITNGAGIMRTQDASMDGRYSFPELPPGSYTVQIIAPGFVKVTATGVTVNVNETAVLNQVMQVGSVSQQVTVSADIEATQTESASLGAVVPQESISSLPLITRNYTQILGLSPGVNQSVADAGVFGEGVQGISVNGNNNDQNNYQLDGSDIYNFNNGTANDSSGFFGSTSIPSPDAIQEFKVQTANWDASYGQHSGSNVNIVSKSGTNDWHGSTFEFVRNTAFNANDFFRNRLGQPRAELKQNQFGGTAGGPIVHDKLFLFLSYQGTRQVNGLAAQGLQGINLPYGLTDTRTAAALGAAFCPANNIAGSSYANGTFAGGQQVACDGSNINPVALAILNTKLPSTGYGAENGSYFIPTPQSTLNPGAASAVGFSTFTIPAVFNEDQVLGSLDYSLTAKHHLTYKYYFANDPNTVQFNCTPCAPGSGESRESGNQNNIAKITSTLTNNLVNEGLFSIYYIRASVHTLDPVTAPSVGMTPNAAWYPELPVLAFTSPGFTIGGNTIDGAKSPESQYEWQDQITWLRGRHTIRAGYTQEYIRSYNLIYGYNRGELTFQTFQDFLLGDSASQNGSPSGLSNIQSTTVKLSNPPGTINLLRANYLAGFVQDDMKIGPKLTINAGLRWEYDGSWYNALGTAYDAWLSILKANPIPPLGGTYEGYTQQPNYNASAYPALPSGFTIRSKGVLTKNGSPLHDFGPRVGVAWQPFSASGHFVVRAGYGWFYDRIHGNTQGLVYSGSQPVSAPLTNTGTGNAAATLANPLNPAPSLGYASILRTQTSQVAPGSNVDEVQYPNLITTYSLDLQYEFWRSWVLDVGYVGTRGYRLQSTEYFPVPQLAGPGNGINCAASFGCVTTNTSANAYMRDPVLGFAPGGISDAADVGDSYYSSIQPMIRKNFSHGFQVQGSYTFAKSIDDESELSNVAQPVKSTRGRSNYINPQRFVVNYVYNLPSIHRDSGLVGRALSGWGVSGVTTVQDGLPLTFTDSNGGGAYGFISNSQAQFCPSATVANVQTSGTVKSRLTHFFNPSAFALASQPTSATCPFPLAPYNTLSNNTTDLKATLYGNSGTGIVLGPGQFNSDIVISKNTKVGGLRKEANLEFRAEMFNAFNHAQFSAPSAVVSSAAFGTITTTSVSPRIVQFALKYTF